MATEHLPVFIRDLAILLATAGVISILFKWLKQPLILGYLVAGVLVGPKTPIFPSVTEVENIKLWGEIGVIFVLFSLGLEFSFRRLLRLGGSAAITAVVQTVLVFALGALAARALGWSNLDGIFWGGMLAISSTTVIYKVFEDYGLKKRHFAQLVIGILIFEDLVAILLLVLLSTVAVTREVSGGELAWATGRLLFFLILWFAVGLFALPALVRSVRRLLNEETVLVFSLGLCLMMVVVAAESGFSPALGAFVMGSLLAETAEGERIEKLLHSLRNFFGAIFFVSVGMLLDIQVAINQWPLILMMSTLLILAKTGAVTLGAVLAGESVGTALRAGLSLSQIGEFSFIIAGLGMSLNVISPELYPLAVGVAIVTAFTSPYLIASGDRLVPAIERRIPKIWMDRLLRYQALLEGPGSSSVGANLVKTYLPLIAINGVLFLTTAWVFRHWIYPRIGDVFGFGPEVRLLSLAANFILLSPFLYALVVKVPKGGAQQSLLTTVVRILRGALGFALVLSVIAQYVSWQTFSWVVALVFITAGGVLWFFGPRLYGWLEKRFLVQFEDSNQGASPTPVVPWDQHLTELIVGADSPLIGMTIGQIGPQESFQVMIVAIGRGQRQILAPRATDSIFPGDRLQVLGADEGIERLRKLAELTEPPVVEELPLSLQSLVLNEDSPLCGVLLKDSNIRERVDGLVVGFERGGRRTIQPPADLRLSAGDRLWIVGDPDKIPSLNGRG